jgi:hypothetical protein
LQNSTFSSAGGRETLFFPTPKTGGAIFAQRREEDADLSVILSYPGHSSSTDFFRRSRQRNHRNNAETRRNIGRDKSRWAQLPAFSLYS